VSYRYVKHGPAVIQLDNCKCLNLAAQYPKAQRVSQAYLAPNSNTFTGSAESMVVLSCFFGRENSHQICEIRGLASITSPPQAIGPASITSSPGSGGPSTPVAGSDDKCVLKSPDKSDGWQFLSFIYGPPTPQPEKSPYPPTSLRVELRNLADGSNTLCYLETNDIKLRDEGIILSNKGASMDPEGTRNGCLTGRWKKTSATRQEWWWQGVANLTFNTKTHEMTVRQLWNCPNAKKNSVILGSTVKTFQLDCKDTGTEFHPRTCMPKQATYTASSGPQLLGPAKLTNVGLSKPASPPKI
jgi:hypothetical protein